MVADVRPPASFRPKATFAQLDVRDRAAVRELVERERPDCLVHLAFLLNPIRDDAAMYDVDVNGTQNVLEAASPLLEASRRERVARPARRSRPAR